MKLHVQTNDYNDFHTHQRLLKYIEMRFWSQVKQTVICFYGKSFQLTCQYMRKDTSVT